MTLQPTEAQQRWLKNGSPWERLAVFNDALYVLTSDLSIRCLTAPSLNKAQIQQLRSAITSDKLKVSLIESPVCEGLLASVIRAEDEKMQGTMQMMTANLDIFLEVEMCICYVSPKQFDTKIQAVST